MNEEVLEIDSSSQINVGFIFNFLLSGISILFDNNYMPYFFLLRTSIYNLEANYTDLIGVLHNSLCFRIHRLILGGRPLNCPSCFCCCDFHGTGIFLLHWRHHLITFVWVD